MFQVRENDALPKYFCLKCASDVKSALITKRRIIKAHKYLVENLAKRYIPSTSDHKAQSSKRAVSAPSKIAESDERTERSRITDSKCSPATFINENAPISHKWESLCEYTTPEVEAKVEVLNKRQHSNDTSAADEESGSGSTNEISDKNNTHIKTSPGQINYICKECNVSFTRKHAYTLHCEKHKKNKCDICNKFIRRDNFKKHLLVHASGPSVCKMCGVTYKNFESLRSHTYQRHSDRSGYVCEECGAKFRSKYYLLLHKTKVHTGVKNFKCDTCGRAFFTKHFLMKHDKMTHKKLRPHICEFCGTGFSSRYALKTHKRLHTNEKPFLCDPCNEGFRQKVSLRSHLKSKHGIEEAKESICSECGRGFATNYALNIHQRLHASMKCEVCSKSFAGQEYLDNHMKEVHRIDSEVEKDANVKSALITKRRIIKSYKYIIEHLGKRNLPSTSDQKAQSSKKATLKPTEIATPDKRTEPCKTVGTKSSTDENNTDSQNSENIIEYITTKVEIKVEVLDERQSNSDASIADKKSGTGSTNEIRDKRKEKINKIREPLIMYISRNKKTKCDICNKMIRSGNFKKHLLVHSSGPSACNLCGTTYKKLGVFAHTYIESTEIAVVASVKNVGLNSGANTFCFCTGLGFTLVKGTLNVRSVEKRSSLNISC
nr:unnamed protein product [Callosobruchus analis]